MIAKKIKNLIIIFSCLIAVLTVAHFALALDVGLSYGEQIGLGNEDPKVVIASIIRVALGFLGIVAVAIILYGGWLWMTAAGDEEKIRKAKKLLVNAVIGLIIILSAFLIVSFIISKLLEATGGGGGPVCDPPCSGATPHCCNNVCQADPCVITPPSTSSFYITSTSPKNNTIGNPRNVVTMTFYNKDINHNTTQEILDANFKVEKIADVDPSTGNETPVTPQIIAGQVALATGWQEINFKASAGCGNEQGTPNCLPEWSKFKVTINAASGIVSESNQSLGNINTVFEFSTNNVIDTGPPTAGLTPTQMCKDDGTLKPEANTIGGWGNDDVGLSALKFYEQKTGDPESLVYTKPGASQKYLYEQYKYDTEAMKVGDEYTFKVEALDLAAANATANFKTTIKPGHCCNGAKDADEEDVDCGGADCLACAGGPCNVNEPNQCVINGEGNCSDSLCSTMFCDCQIDDCICKQKPIIYWISPQGGFCENDHNKFCRQDGDCTNSICNKTTPNGAAGNFITIGGKYFGSTIGQVHFKNSSGGWVEAKLANDPQDGNAQCGNDVWKNNQIIVIIPTGLNVQNSEIKVKSADGYDDTTQDNRGPKIDFVINTINRPGLCKLDPSSGKMNDQLTYFGIKMNGGQAYFGNLSEQIAGYDSNFQEKQGSAKVPNLATGLTSSFVIKSNVNSNFLNFIKEEEPYLGPEIVSFEPIQGRSGQYVTIYGKRFGNTKGASKVYFGGVEASYNFPKICADSVWSDNQVIVKVPEGIDNGDYLIKMKIGSWPEVDSSKLTNPTFKVDSLLPLLPSLCKINPIMGPKLSEVSLWGEYFGVQASGKVRFYLNKDQSGSAISFWGPDESVTEGLKPDKAKTTVHLEASTGPVKILQTKVEACTQANKETVCGKGWECNSGKCELIGNGINFKVGSCAKNEECGSGFICCGETSPNKGRCMAGSTEQEACYPEVNACVYEWDFSTGVGQIGIPCDGDNNPLNGCQADNTKCPSNLPHCNTNTCLCEPETLESCSGINLNQCANTKICPNSPGQCSVGQITNTGSCNCQYLFGPACANNSCTYKNNACQKNSATCSIYENVANAKIGNFNVPNDYTPICQIVGITNKWQVDRKGGASCPNETFMDTNGKCTLGTPGNYPTCYLCPNSFYCAKDGSETDNTGICLIGSNLCPNGSNCSSGQCVYGDPKPQSCECCCRIANANQDCCAPLKCEGNCGSDAVVDENKYGFCSGCANVGTTPEEHNAACNCSGTTGKFCDTSVAGGACRDCTQITNSSQCTTAGVGQCCVDHKNNDACRGGTDNLIIDNLAYCSYYSCSDASCGSASITGMYKTSTCDDQCGIGDGAGISCASEETEPDECKIDKCDYNYYACLNENGSGPTPPDSCGICCCDPSANPDKCTTKNPDYPNLKCKPDQDPCSGDKRGLCCGCERDDHCGNSDIVGCGSIDNCCHARPAVESVTPPEDAVKVCRNTIISAQFNQLMDISSFSGNVLVFGEYGVSPCPAGTEYLTLKKDYQGPWIARLAHRFMDWLGLRNFSEGVLTRMPVVRKLFFGQASAAIGNFCAIKGTVSGYNSADDKTTLTFSPSQLLDAGRTYYAVIKGDSNPADSQKEGVLSYYGISMKGLNEETFNAVPFKNSKIWSFTTLSAQAPNNGVCVLDHVTIDPTSYLFQTTENNIQDDDLNNQKFDSIKDSDKLFVAKAVAPDGQVIIPISGVYNWGWSWTSSQTGVANFINLANLENSKRLLRANPDIKEGKTIITARATIDADTVFNPSTVGQFKEAKSDVWVFVCANPWPSVINGTWEPWIDNSTNCLPDSGTCHNTNYEIYYCRDAGGAGTADDLPAILSETVTRGQSAVQNLLKESYFFRTVIPDVSGLNVQVASLPQEGGKVSLNWNAVSPPTGETLDKYIVYYGTSPKSYTETISTANTNITVSNLKNDTNYYFAVTAKFKSGAESVYSAEVSATPKDTKPPAKPTGFQVTSGQNQVTLKWNANTDDTAKYKIYYGTAHSVYGEVIEVGKDTQATITDLSSENAFYYFTVSALDAYGNESAKADELIVLLGSEGGVFQNVLTNIDFENGSVGQLPSGWSRAIQKHSSIGISNNTSFSGTKSVLIHRDPNQDYPGKCNEAICNDMADTFLACTWLANTEQCQFPSDDTCHTFLQGAPPSIYNKDDDLCWGNIHRVMWANLIYDVAPLNWQAGKKYLVAFFIKGKSDIDIGVSLSYHPGWATQCADKNPPYIKQDGSCLYGFDCSEQANMCCAQAPYLNAEAPYQTKCYTQTLFKGITKGEIIKGPYNGWYLYLDIFKYTEAMSKLLDVNGKLNNRVAIILPYGSTGPEGTDLYIDDFIVAEAVE